ncbi:hypothetical protein [Lysobacter sp. CA199]|uniref:hypothetical protein n=1 Tax=Lysobacter sp. CA199 TaxID=3455608 RepID=UPI003F8D87DA
MGPQDRQHSTRPAALGLLALALGAAVLAVAVPALRKPEREGWIALPPQPMDATDYDIRQLLDKSARIANPSGSAQGPRGLASHCGREDAEPATPPLGAGAFAPIPIGASQSDIDPDPLPPGGDRYLMLLGPFDGSALMQQVQIDVYGDRARLRVRDGNGYRFSLHPATRLEDPAASRTDHTFDLSQLKALREAWNTPELWTAPQRSAVFCAQDYGAHEAFFEACVDGRYFARDRGCDRAAQPQLQRLWQSVRASIIAPPPAPR